MIKCPHHLWAAIGMARLALLCNTFLFRFALLSSVLFCSVLLCSVLFCFVPLHLATLRVGFEAPQIKQNFSGALETTFSIYGRLTSNL